MNKQFIKYTFLSLVAIMGQKMEAQTADKKADELTAYRVTALKVHDLVHTKLDVSFDYGKRHLNGKEWITLKPHFYETDQLTLDAKGMEFKEIAIIDGKKTIPLKYTQDSEHVFITLNRKYKSTEKYVVYIDYIAKPNELKTKGGETITDSKGLYFVKINCDGQIRTVKIIKQ